MPLLLSEPNNIHEQQAGSGNHHQRQPKIPSQKQSKLMPLYSSMSIAGGNSTERHHSANSNRIASPLSSSLNLYASSSNSSANNTYQNNALFRLSHATSTTAAAVAATSYNNSKYLSHAISGTTRTSSNLPSKAGFNGAASTNNAAYSNLSNNNSTSVSTKALNNTSSSSSGNSPSEKKKRSDSVVSLLPIKETSNTNSINSSANHNMSSSNFNSNHQTNSSNMSRCRLVSHGGTGSPSSPSASASNGKASPAPPAVPKRQKSNSLSIMDYCNIMSTNTNYQIMANFTNLSDDVFDSTTITTGNGSAGAAAATDRSTSNSASSSSCANQPGVNYQKQASLSEQMAAMFGSSDCTCLLCRNNAARKSTASQINYEIVANRQNSDFSVMKFVYSAPLSQLSPLKLFNMFNCDCSISFKPSSRSSTSADSNTQSTSNLPSVSSSSSSNLPSIDSAQQNKNRSSSQSSVNGLGNLSGASSSSSSSSGSSGTRSSMHFDNNNPPIYDSHYMYLIDCRLSRKAFDKSRIATAVHYTDVLSEAVYLSPPIDNFTIIVLYDEDGTFLTSSHPSTPPAKHHNNSCSNNTSSSHTNYYKIKNNKENQQQPHQNGSNDSSGLLSLETETLTDSDDIITSLRRKIKCSSGKTIYILSGGYKQFSTQFPFMCTHIDIRSMVDRHKYLNIYPNCVIENQIYIGSGVQAKNWKIIRDLRITHIINASIEHECVFADEIAYLWVKLEDNYTENISKSLVKGCRFMEDAFAKYYEDMDRWEEGAGKNGSQSRNSSGSDPAMSETERSGGQAGRPHEPIFLIHCNLGISRSSSILIAYLIAKYRLCLYSAFKYVKDKRLQIAPNYSFLRQLKQFEETYNN